MPRTTEPVRTGRRSAPPQNVVKTGRQAPPPPKPPWSRYDPFHQPGEPASGGYIPNPPEYCDAKWERGTTGINWVCTSFCNSCPDRKICEGLKGYRTAVIAKNNGKVHVIKKEWEDEESE